jgi:hypothetical protein
MYATDSNGRYPTDLTRLLPNYLKIMPTCPTAGRVTYRAEFASEPDAYTIVCGGHWHCGVSNSLNYPQYTSTQGLLEK